MEEAIEDRFLTRFYLVVEPSHSVELDRGNNRRTRRLGGITPDFLVAFLRTVACVFHSRAWSLTLRPRKVAKHLRTCLKVQEQVSLLFP